MSIQDWLVNKSTYKVPKEISCFNQWTLYQDIRKAEYDFRELLKSDLTHHWIIGSDLPYKYWININIYTPYKQMKDDFKWKNIKKSD